MPSMFIFSLVLCGLPSFANAVIGGACSDDDDCKDNGSFCSSSKKCVWYTRHYCYYNTCGLGDADCDPYYDYKGCGTGLKCGVNNCAKYHTLGYTTGIGEGSDCCEPAGPSDSKLPPATDSGKPKSPHNYYYYYYSHYKKAKRYPKYKKSKDYYYGYYYAHYKTINKDCNTDSDCTAQGSYCSSLKKCIWYSKDYCYYHNCGLGDADCDAKYDYKGCGSGLVCGTNNCAKFHTLGGSTGIGHGSDCCELAGAGAAPPMKVPDAPKDAPKPPAYKPMAGACKDDDDCTADGQYCSSKKVCTWYSKDYCYYNDCGLGDADCDQYYDWKGCGAGLVCGTDNCATYHKIGYRTGISAGSDCCEPAHAPKYHPQPPPPQKQPGDIPPPPPDATSEIQKTNSIGNKCNTDADCPDKGSFCSAATGCCVWYTKDYCYYNDCGLGDADCDRYYDWKGCGHGLVCGYNNCAKYHKLGPDTGIGEGSDCCEPLVQSSPHRLPGGNCHTDTDCGYGSYCDSKKHCVQYSKHHCYYNECGLGDADCDDQYDHKGCGAGLKCGQNNCAKYHLVGPTTGITHASDCCEPIDGFVPITMSPINAPPGGHLPQPKPPAKCTHDEQCIVQGSYCSSKGQCVSYSSDYCYYNNCGLGDADCDRYYDNYGCASGLVCGYNNCHKFHKIGQQTGIREGSDCCEHAGPPPKPHLRSADAWHVGGVCRSDLDCPFDGTYCSSQKRCVEYTKHFCYYNSCGLGDADCDGDYDWKGCGVGLRCGSDNCAKYHALGAFTGINYGSDCCEPATTPIQVGAQHGEAHAGHNNGMHWNPDLSSHQEQQSDQGEFRSERKVIPLQDFVVETDAEEAKEVVTIGTLIDSDETTKKPEQVCLDWCESKPRPWVEKCQWEKCSACPKCDALPTRKRTTTESTTTTVTEEKAIEAKVTEAAKESTTTAKVTKAKTTEAKATEAKATEAKATEAKATEAKATEAKATEAKATEAEASTESVATTKSVTTAEATEAEVAGSEAEAEAKTESVTTGPVVETEDATVAEPAEPATPVLPAKTEQPNAAVVAAAVIDTDVASVLGSIAATVSTICLIFTQA